ncbi:sigma-70 family RNA polymerase sigma factor [Streptomyces varsoviensis]|uniref:sigma-70 family RNA polymerase sigma factor n=1 Tax=Streptomyces varsoviensis TaxID=67373 RepID=UPI00340C8B97
MDLPIDFEAFHLGHQEFFHTFAELHLGSRAAAEECVHRVFLEIRADRDGLLQEEGLEQHTLAVLHRHVTTQLEREQRDPAFIINGPIARSLRAVRDELELAEGTCGLYEAITLLPPRQFTVIVLRHLMGYPTRQIARYMGLDERTVDYHGQCPRAAGTGPWSRSCGELGLALVTLVMPCRTTWCGPRSRHRRARGVVFQLPLRADDQRQRHR